MIVSREFQRSVAMAKTLFCAITGCVVDRDVNTALNLRDWSESNAGPGPVGSSAPVDTRAADIGRTDPGLDGGLTRLPEERP